jgi:hypothetical protein
MSSRTRSGLNLLRRLGIPLAAALIAATIATSIAPIRLSAGSHAAPPSRNDLKPLVDVHEFMEHVVEGTFATVKNGLNDRPADAKAWRLVRDASLLLGESGNLLLIRKPEAADDAEWSKRAIALRESGDALGKAAKTRDYGASRKAYVTLVQACNQCHAKYGDDGEPKISARSANRTSAARSGWRS